MCGAIGEASHVGRCYEKIEFESTAKWKQVKDSCSIRKLKVLIGSAYLAKLSEK